LSLSEIANLAANLKEQQGELPPKPSSDDEPCRPRPMKPQCQWSCVPCSKDIYLVLDDFGRLGRAWRETDEAGASRSTLVRNLLEGQYENPVRIVAFTTAEGWSRDVTFEIADELRRRYVEYNEIPASVLRFLETAIWH
jgi:hypothetical protein